MAHHLVAQGRQTKRAEMDDAKPTRTADRKDQMTDQEMRVAIAEWVGWKVEPMSVKGGWKLHLGQIGPSFWWHGEVAPTLSDVAYQLPLYETDLNAMKEAIDAQPLEVQKAMRAEVWRLSSQMTVLPSARVFAEALLRTIGKWKD